MKPLSIEDIEKNHHKKTRTQKIISPEKLVDDAPDKALRPKTFQEFIGQQHHIANLSVFIQAARERQEPLDHVLLYGPPGLGKTTLAYLIAHHMHGQIRLAAGPILTKPGDLASLLTQLNEGDILFIDEIHRMPIAVEEMLYSAMEDYRIDIMLGEGAHAKSLQLPLPPFTLIGATTRSGLISAPLRDRFGISMPLSFYDSTELADVLLCASKRWGMTLSQECALILGQRSRGTPRIALRLLRRIRDFAAIYTQSDPTPDQVLLALDQMGVNAQGLDSFDQRYIWILHDFFKGGPAGLDTLAAAMAETKDALEDIIEPYLLQQGFIQRTSRGRQLTEKGHGVAFSMQPSFLEKMP